MENQEIASTLRFMASLLELHDENPFKIRALQTAIFTIDKYAAPLCGKSESELASINGIGKSAAGKIIELCISNTLTDLQNLITQTPEGVIEMLDIKGIGPKKVRALWKELGLVDKSELLLACQENKVAQLKGFGQKTQETIQQNLIFKETHKDKYLYAEVEHIAEELVSKLQSSGHADQVSLAGQMRRKLEVVENIQLLVATDEPSKIFSFLQNSSNLQYDENISGPYAWRGTELNTGIKLEVKVCAKDKYGSQLYVQSSAENHIGVSIKENKTLLQLALRTNAASESEFVKQIGLDFIEPEMREGYGEVELALAHKLPLLLQLEDLKGTLHNHSTYSDGKNTIEEMAIGARNLGLQYLGLCDHSRAGAFYNGGLYENRVLEQHKEIDELNKKLAPFKIFKGIESDILSDGNLDYENSILSTFDFIVSSIHSNLKMTEAKATERIVKAIENPYTTILGHASGRILLQREAYPLDYTKVIDACAANGVVIEINADPHRLDMDWRQLYYALAKGVMISINPDAHSIHGYANTRYGVYIGRKAGLTKDLTLNAMSLEEITAFFKKKKSLVTTD